MQVQEHTVTAFREDFIECYSYLAAKLGGLTVHASKM
jgi:hypothetical protein